MNTLRIRIAEVDDLSAIQRVTKSAFQPVVDALGYRPSPMSTNFLEALSARFVLVAELDAGRNGGLELPTRTLVGYAATSPRASGVGRAVAGPQFDSLRRAGSLYLSSLAVSTGAQRRGVGRGLIEAVERLSAGLSLPRVLLHTDPRLSPAVNFYDACGFDAIGAPMAGVGPGPRQLFSKSVRTLLDQRFAAAGGLGRR